MQESRCLDHRIKLILVPFLGAVSFCLFRNELYFTFFLMIDFLIIYYAGQWIKAIKFTLLFVLLMAIEYVTLYFYISSITMILSSILFVFNRLLVFFLLGSFLRDTTNISELICTMEKLRFPRVVMIPFSVMMRFMPTMREDVEALRNSMKLRGINTSIVGFIKSPIKYIEYLFVPLLMRALKVSEEIAASATLRGLDSPRKKDSLVVFKSKTSDWVFVATYSILMLCLIVIQTKL